MQQNKKCITLALATLLFFQASFATAGAEKTTAPNKSVIIPAYNMKVYDQAIEKLYANHPGSRGASIATRVETDSTYFLGQPYLLGALGEGPNGQFDKRPLYRSDAFDCVTYVATIVALANSRNLQEFKKVMPKVDYKNGKVTYVNRNHFMSVDWNKNNEHDGYVQDITYKFLDRNGEPIAQVANTIINKPEWYNRKLADNIKSLKPLSSQQQATLLTELRDQGKQLQKEKSVLLYLPLTKLFDKQGQANNYIFNQIPSGSIIEIVRPNWDREKIMGTRVNVSHLGLAIRTKQGLMYREASSLEHKVVDEPLTEYLKGYLNSPTIKGINVQLIT